MNNFAIHIKGDSNTLIMQSCAASTLSKGILSANYKSKKRTFLAQCHNIMVTAHLKKKIGNNSLALVSI